MRIPSGVTDQYIYFVAVDATDYVTRETGLSSFTVYRSRNGGAAASFTTPTINETSSANMPGVYELLLDEDMTIDAGDDSQEMVFHITHAGMAPVTRTIELYRPKVTAGETLTVASGAGAANVTQFGGTNGTFAGGRPEVNATHWAGTAVGSATVRADLINIAGAAVNTASAQLGVNVVNFGGAAGTFSGGRPEVNASHWGGTAVGSANVRANLTQILGTAPTEGAAGRLAGAFTAFFNVASPVLTTASVNQTGDSFARIGATGSGLTSLASQASVDGIVTTLGTPADTSVSQDIANARGVLDTVAADVDDLQVQVGVAGDGLTAVPWNAAWDAEVQSEVQDAIEANHLDHLLAADYDPAAKPGVATALLNELIGNDAGVSQFTANALELAPTGGSAPTVAQIVAGVWDEPTAGNTTSGTFGAAVVAAGSAGDPWSTSLPGAYGAGTAGFAVGTYLTGNAYTRLGAPAGASVSADVAAVKAETASIQTDTNDIQTRLPAALVGGRMDASVGAFTAGALQAFLTTDTTLTAGDVAAGSVVSAVAGAMVIHDTGYLNTDPVTGSVVKAGAFQTWEEPKAAHATADTFGDYLDDEVTSRSSHSAADVVTALGTGATLTTLATAAAVADLPTNAELATALDALPTAAEVATAVWANATRTLTAFGFTTFPTNFGSLAITAGGVVSADAKAVNGVTLGGTGVLGDEWGPA